MAEAIKKTTVIDTAKEFKNDLDIRKEELKKKLPFMQARDAELVQGIFRFHEVRGGTMKFPFRQYRGEPIATYELQDGQVYKIPLGVARHLNKNCWYPVHAFAQDGNGNRLPTVGKKVRRCSFQSLEFMDSETLHDIGDPCMPDIIVTSR